MPTDIETVEEIVSVTNYLERTDIAVSEPQVTVEVAGEKVDVSVVSADITVSVDSDRIDLEVIEQITQIVIAEGASTTTTVPQEEEVYDIEVDSSVAGMTYVGQALPGTASSAAAWRIKRITENASGSSVDWAAGTSAFIHPWTQHLSLSYGP